jgi:hypothetical protein
MSSYPRGKEPTCPTCQTNTMRDRYSKQCRACYRTPGWFLKKAEPVGLSDDEPPTNSYFDDEWDRFNRWLGRTRTITPGPPKHEKPGRSIVHFSDLHIPFLNQSALLAAIEANRDADVCVIGGDALNAGAASRFIESEIVHPKDEFAKLTVILQTVAETFPEVRVNIGNHPDRIRKYFGTRIAPYMMFLVRTNPLEYVAEGLKREQGVSNITVAKPIIDGLDNSNFVTLVGDCAFTHAEAHSKISTRPAENVARWLRRWERHLPNRPRVVVQEHNHRGGKFYDDELGALLIQAPCLSQNVSYQATSDIKYGPNQLGWVRIEQDADGHCLINRCNYFLLDEHGRERVA